MKFKLLTLSLVLGVFFQRANGSGFPTFDIANLTQSITEYTLLLEEYDQILQQTGLSTDQLLQAVEQYEQTLREYQVLLNQVSAFQHKIEQRNYEGIINDVALLSQEYQGIAIAPNTEAVNRRYGESPDHENLTQLADSAMGYLPQDIEQSYTIANDSNIQERQRLLYENRNVQNRKDIEHLEKQRLSLGDQSELQTLQFALEQNQILIEQIQISNEMQVQQMTYSNQADQRAAQAEYRAKVDRLKRIQYENENPIVIDERPFK